MTRTSSLGDLVSSQQDRRQTFDATVSTTDSQQGALFGRVIGWIGVILLLAAGSVVGVWVAKNDTR